MRGKQIKGWLGLDCSRLCKTSPDTGGRAVWPARGFTEAKLANERLVCDLVFCGHEVKVTLIRGRAGSVLPASGGPGVLSSGKGSPIFSKQGHTPSSRSGPQHVLKT